MTTPGLNIAKLLPVTGTFLPAFTAYYVLLNIRVSLSRIATDVMIGTDTSKKANPESKANSPADERNLMVNTRCQGNFAEFVPLALLMASVAEMNGGTKSVLTRSLATLLFLRIAHAEFGLRADRSIGWGRPVGYFGTLGWILGMSGYSAWLVKGYWNL